MLKFHLLIIFWKSNTSLDFLLKRVLVMLNVFSPLYPYSRIFSCAHCPFFVCGIKQKSEQFDLRVIRVTKKAPHTQKNPLYIYSNKLESRSLPTY